jgi:two-component system phosphate regulon response regulator OmpR
MSENNLHILLIDDDDKIRELLKTFLVENNYLVSTASNAAEAKEILKYIVFDLLVIDIMMPGQNGYELTKEIREKSLIPVIHLTAMGETEDRIHGLEIGADDYLGKPFEPKELLLRIKNILSKTSPKKKNMQIQLDNIIIDLKSGVIKGKSTEQSLNENELKILKILSKVPGKSYSREELITSLNFNQERTLDVCINRLRKKIEKNPRTPKFLKTKRGSGYELWVD